MGVAQADLFSPGQPVTKSHNRSVLLSPDHLLHGLDVSEPRTAAEKAAGLLTEEIKSVEQKKQLANPDARVAFEKELGGELLKNIPIVIMG